MKQYFQHINSNVIYEVGPSLAGLLTLIDIKGKTRKLVGKHSLDKHYTELNNQEVANILFTKED